MIATTSNSDVFYMEKMSNNYVFYAQKVRESKQTRERERPLHPQLAELFELIRHLEADWRSRSRG